VWHLLLGGLWKPLDQAVVCKLLCCSQAMEDIIHAKCTGERCCCKLVWQCCAAVMWHGTLGLLHCVPHTASLPQHLFQSVFGACHLGTTKPLFGVRYVKVLKGNMCLPTASDMHTPVRCCAQSPHACIGIVAAANMPSHFLSATCRQVVNQDVSHRRSHQH
jgi:hypothetical protein